MVLLPAILEFEVHRWFYLVVFYMFLSLKNLWLALRDPMLDIFVKLADQAGDCLQCTFSLNIELLLTIG